MNISLYNTLSRKKERFEPLDPQRVTMYVCGPTVYNFPHIGNARPAVIFDVLYRLLRHAFPSVVYARNITDVDDKINKAARDEGVDINTISERFTHVYHEDMRALGVLDPDIEPRATEHVPAIVSVVESLIESGHAYEVEGHVLFHVPSFEDYGALSGRDREELVAGARVEVAPYKRDPADFVLWKPSTEEQPGWPSPWGRGRPGWHIECSTMIAEHLGTTIDIHAGGQDLIFPHHENEIAQGTCAHGGATYCRYWVHNGFVNVDHQKMSKSLGNVRLVRELLEIAAGEAIRLALLNAHYRKPLDWTAEGLEQARRMLDRLYGTLRRLPRSDAKAAPSEGLLAALADDLNTPRAIAELFQIAKEANATGARDEQARLRAQLLASGEMLGLLGEDPDVWLGLTGDDLDLARIEALVEERSEARRARDFAKADRLRDELQAMGIALEDGPEGPTWRRA
jgi:cysteinyl-tRNA synthetase